MSLNPSRVRFWKRRTPTSLRQAVDESLEYFKEAHNGSVDKLAERMGYATQWALYKDLADLKLKLPQVKAFEHGCGIDLLTRYYTASANRISIEIPVGRTAGADSIQALQSATTEAAGALLKFYSDQMTADDALAAINAAMQELAWHRINVAKYAQPELEW